MHGQIFNGHYDSNETIAPKYVDKMKRNSENSFPRGTRYLICTNDEYQRRKLQLKDGGGCQDQSSVVGFTESIKWILMLNCHDEGHHR